MDSKPYYSVTFALGFIVDNEYAEELDALISKLDNYIKKNIKKIETCSTFDTGLRESGYYEER